MWIPSAEDIITLCADGFPANAMEFMQMQHDNRPITLGNFQLDHNVIVILFRNLIKIVQIFPDTKTLRGRIETCYTLSVTSKHPTFCCHGNLFGMVYIESNIWGYHYVVKLVDGVFKMEDECSDNRSIGHSGWQGSGRYIFLQHLSAFRALGDTFVVENWHACVFNVVGILL